MGSGDSRLGPANVGAAEAHSCQVRWRQLSGGGSPVCRGDPCTLRALARLELGVDAAHPRLLPLRAGCTILFLLALGKEVLLQPAVINGSH